MEPSSHEVVCYGEVLWDILPTAALPGGAPMNVAYHLKKLGSSPAMISKIGTDNYGEKLVNILAENGLVTEFVQVDFKYPTGLVYANVNDSHEVVYDIVDPSAWDLIEWSEEFTGLLRQSRYFVYGSLAGRNKVSRNTLYELLDTANTKVLDINLRKPHYNQHELEYLLLKADILKMNEAELELVSGWFSSSKRVEDRIKIVQDRFSIGTVIVTLGGEGAMVNDKGVVYRHPGFTVTVADTIGSGDSFLAGFIHQSLKGLPVEDALNFASALGAFIATQPGGCPRYETADLNQFIYSNSPKSLQTVL